MYLLEETAESAIFGESVLNNPSPTKRKSIKNKNKFGTFLFLLISIVLINLSFFEVEKSIHFVYNENKENNEEISLNELIGTF